MASIDIRYIFFDVFEIIDFCFDVESIAGLLRQSISGIFVGMEKGGAGCEEKANGLKPVVFVLIIGSVTRKHMHKFVRSVVEANDEAVFALDFFGQSRGISLDAMFKEIFSYA